MRVWAKPGETPVLKVAVRRDKRPFEGALNLKTGQESVLGWALRQAEPVWKATGAAVSHNHQRVGFDILCAEFETHLKTRRFPWDLLERGDFHTISTIFNWGVYKNACIPVRPIRST
jgi:hypothetical protein